MTGQPQDWFAIVHKGEKIFDNTQGLLAGMPTKSSRGAEGTQDLPSLQRKDKYQIVKNDDDTYKLVVRDVQAADAGSFDIVTSNQRGKVFERLTLEVPEAGTQKTTWVFQIGFEIIAFMNEIIHYLIHIPILGKIKYI